MSAALTVLARDGLERVGMRSVASELGTAPMSLYRHVRGRDALIELVRQRVMTPPGGLAPSATGAWRERLRALLEGARAQLRRYPNAIALFDSENFRQPAASSSVERALECLAEAGLDPKQAARASATLWMYTVGAVLAEQSAAAAWPGEDLPPGRRKRWIAGMQKATAESAPRVTSMMPRWSGLSHDEVFSEGLELLLAGLERAGTRRGR